MEELEEGQSYSSPIRSTTPYTLRDIFSAAKKENLQQESEIWHLGYDEQPGESGAKESNFIFMSTVGGDRLELKSHFFPIEPALSSQHWNLSLSRLLIHGPGPIATELINRSYENFSRLTFEDFLAMAQGYPSEAITSFLLTYDLLVWKVYSTFIKHAHHFNLLVQLKDTLEKSETDPFVLCAIERALRCVTLKRAPDDDEAKKDGQPIDLIIEPLRDFLARSDPKLRDTELNVLKTRFHKQYHGVDNQWTAFNTNTEFLNLLQSLQPSSLARLLSRQDKAFFETYISDAFTSQRAGRMAQRQINTRWNVLTLKIQECMAGGAHVSRDIDRLAEELYRLRNYYSLTAVIQGVMASDVQTPTLQKYGKLVKPDNNYEVYRQHMISRWDNGTLHFLFPALANSKRGDFTLATVVINGHRAYNCEDRQDSSPLDFIFSCFRYFGCFGCFSCFGL